MQAPPADATQPAAGRGANHRGGSPPRSWLVRARRGGREDTSQLACPGYGRSAHSGAGEELADVGDAPADATQRSPWWG